MHIYLHHSGDDVIDLNSQTGAWGYLKDDEHASLNELAIAYRHSDPINGTYTIENEKRYCLYWTPEKILILRTPDEKQYRLFKYLGEDKYLNLMDGMQVELLPSTFTDGRARQGYSDFRLINNDGHVLHELSYFSQKYLNFYANDFTFVPDRDLTDWDFFVALKAGVEDMVSKSVAMPEVALKNDSTNLNLRELGGQACSQNGYWFTPAKADSRRYFKQGDIMSIFDSSTFGATIWQWCEDQSSS
jgi:hypothetical protein